MCLLQDKFAVKQSVKSPGVEVRTAPESLNQTLKSPRTSTEALRNLMMQDLPSDAAWPKSTHVYAKHVEFPGC